MHYPTHSTCGPVCVLQSHAVKVTADGDRNRNHDACFDDNAFSNEVALFQMANGATVRICEFRELAGSFHHDETLDHPDATDGSHAYLVHEFVDAVTNRRQPAIHAWEAARYMVMGVVAHQSVLRDGEMLHVPDFGDPPGEGRR